MNASDVVWLVTMLLLIALGIWVYHLIIRWWQR